MQTTIIDTPGKFEGEPTYVPRFWDLVLEGASDETLYDQETPIDVFYLGRDDMERYPELFDGYAIALWESSNGFVFSDVLTRAELDRLRQWTANQTED